MKFKWAKLWINNDFNNNLRESAWFIIIFVSLIEAYMYFEGGTLAAESNACLTALKLNILCKQLYEIFKLTLC